MNKEFIPYKQALELKELGFDEKCIATYQKLPMLIPILSLGEKNNDFYKRIRVPLKYNIPAPLYQQAFRWFRDKKLIDGSVSRHGESDGGYSYRWDIIHEYGVYEERHFKKGYKTYEEAELDCLKMLIEIVKNK